MIHFIDRDCRAYEHGEIAEGAEGIRDEGAVREVKDMAGTLLFVYTSKGKLRFSGDERRTLLDGVGRILRTEVGQA